MRKLDITRSTEIKNGDLMAVMNAQSELEGLLNLICEDDFKGFRRLAARQQLDLLALARTLADDMGGLFGTYFAAQAIRQAKQKTQEVVA